MLPCKCKKSTQCKNTEVAKKKTRKNNVFIKMFSVQ